MEFVQIAGSLSASHLRERRDDDMWIDRLCHRYSVVLFTIFAILVTSKAYIGDPIDCWAPPEFKSSYERYAETLCFVNGTYHISVNELDIPIDPKERYSNRIRYYQWTPFILLLQAFFMYLPRLIWLSFNSRYGLNLKNLVDAAKKYETVEGSDNREKILVYMCKNLLRSIQYKDYRRNRHKRLTDSHIHETYLKNQKALNKMLTLSMQPSSSSLNGKRNQLLVSHLTTPFTIYENEIRKKIKREMSNESSSSIRLSKQDQELFKTYAKIESEIQNNEQDMSLNVLRSRINTLSRKHLLNVFTSGYETTDQPIKHGQPSFSQDNVEESKNFRTKLKKLSFIPDLNKNYLCYLYIFVKFCYLLSLFGQVFILNRLIGNNFYKLGIDLILSFLYNSEWPQLAIFPRISLCEIYIREIGTVHPYLIQCVLRINLFNELIFILVWFWLCFVVCLTGIDLVARFFYTIVSCSNCQRKLFALKYLELIHLNATCNLFMESTVRKSKRVDHIIIEQEEEAEEEEQEQQKEDYHENMYDNNNFEKGQTRNKKKVLNRYVLVKATRNQEFDLFEKFCDILTGDSVFALRIIQQNASNLIVSELIEYLWRQFKLLNFVYSNETNDFFLKKIITHSKKNKRKKP